MTPPELAVAKAALAELRERIMRDTCARLGERLPRRAERRRWLDLFEAGESIGAIAAHAWGSHGPGVDEDLVEAVIRYERAPKRVTMRRARP